MTGAVIIMGVSGCGKSTLGPAIAETLGWKFVDGDTLHPPENVAKMAAGTALDDADREPFLEHVARAISEHRGAGVVVACSALRRSYRDLIRTRAGNVTFVLPILERETLLARLARRRSHFMPTSLLDSQLALLELPGSDEQVIVVDGNGPVQAQVGQVLAALQAGATAGQARAPRRGAD